MLEAKEKLLEKKDVELEKKKEEAKKMKLELINIKEEMALKEYQHVPVDVQGARQRKTKTKPTEEKEKQFRTKSTEAGFPCTKCDKNEKTKSDLMIHMDVAHKEHEELITNAQKEVPARTQGIPCRNGDNCSWNRSNRCKFVHQRRTNVEEHKRNNHSSRRRQEEPELCRNGPECGYERNGVCRFSHHQDRYHGRWEEQPRRHGFRKHNREHREEEMEPVRRGNFRNPGEPVGWCWEGDNCRRKRYCMYKH